MSVLLTPRLTLREMTIDDLDDMAGLLGDPEVMRHYPRPKTRAEAVGWIEWNQRLYQKRGHGLWIMQLREGGSFVGDCGLTVQQVDGAEEIELGYHVQTRYQGSGFATEAAIACRDYARDTLGVDRLIAVVTADNLSSQRVAEKAGLALEKRTTGWGSGEREVLIFAAALRSPVGVNRWDDDRDLLPDATEDETGPGWGEDLRESDDDQRLLDERPPHWG